MINRLEIHVPTMNLSTIGLIVDKDLILEFENIILKHVDGFIATHGMGAWKNNGKVYRDTQFIYYIDSSTLDILKKLQTEAEIFIMEKFEQLNVHSLIYSLEEPFVWSFDHDGYAKRSDQTERWEKVY